MLDLKLALPAGLIRGLLPDQYLYTDEVDESLIQGDGVTAQWIITNDGVLVTDKFAKIMASRAWEVVWEQQQLWNAFDKLDLFAAKEVSDWRAHTYATLIRKLGLKKLSEFAGWSERSGRFRIF